MSTPVTVQLIEIPARSMPTKCRGCPEQIFWVMRRNAKGILIRVPVSTQCEDGAEPTPFASGQGVNHFTNCPAAADFHKKKK